MRFPGQRKRTHFFPGGQAAQVQTAADSGSEAPAYDVVGIDQTILDVVLQCDDGVLSRFGLGKRCSVHMPEDALNEIYRFGHERGLIRSSLAGGAVGNTLHNYSVLSGRESLLLGAMSQNIHPADSAFRYIRTTSPLVNLEHMLTLDGPIGRAITFVSQDGERSFAIAPGIANEYQASALPIHLIRRASCAVASLYLFRSRSAPVYDAQMALMGTAWDAGVPVILSLGLAALVREQRGLSCEILKTCVTVAAMNAEEACALTGTDNPMLALDEILDWTDMAMITAGGKGLFIGGWVDEDNRRETDYELCSQGIADYSRYEYSRVQRRTDCRRPMKIYTHIDPYLGGPRRIASTNGAGDAALAAVIHDVCANAYSLRHMPGSEKHLHPYLTYSSVAQIAKYANSVCYEVLKHPPRLLTAEGLSLGEQEPSPAPSP